MSTLDDILPISLQVDWHHEQLGTIGALGKYRDKVLTGRATEFAIGAACGALLAAGVAALAYPFIT